MITYIHVRDINDMLNDSPGLADSKDVAQLMLELTGDAAPAGRCIIALADIQRVADDQYQPCGLIVGDGHASAITAARDILMTLR